MVEMLLLFLLTNVHVTNVLLCPVKVSQTNQKSESLIWESGFYLKESIVF